MQNLWSRIGKVGCSCRCPSCLQHKHTLVRHVSTVAGRLRARPKESATFIYSAVFATAALTDRHQKKQRRSHWDEAIKRAQEEVEAQKGCVDEKSKESGVVFERGFDGEGFEFRASREELETEARKLHPEYYAAKASPARGHRPKVGYDKFHVVGTAAPLVVEELTADDVMRYAALPQAERPPWSTTTAGRKYQIPTANHMPPESLWSGDIQRIKAQRNLWTFKKLSLMELSIAKLVLQMFTTLGVSGEPPSNLLILPEVVRPYARLTLKEQQALLRQMNEELYYAHQAQTHFRPEVPNLGIPIPSYNMSENGAHVEIARELNDALLSLLRAYQNVEISFKALMIKILTNLLISPAPPDIQTTNILLLGFHHMHISVTIPHCDRFIDCWIQLVREANIRPNEITCATILANYRKRNMADAFARFVAMMRGFLGGLMNARPGIRFTESQGRLVPNPKYPLRIIQAVSPSTVVQQEVVKGVLAFAGIEQAVDICEQLGKSGWGLNWVCLWDLLLAALFAKDWERGLVVWEQVELLATSSRIPSRIISAMLALCVECSQKEMFETVHREELAQKWPWPDVLEQAYALVGEGERVRRMKEDGADGQETALALEERALDRGMIKGKRPGLKWRQQREALAYDQARRDEQGTGDVDVKEARERAGELAWDMNVEESALEAIGDDMAAANFNPEEIGDADDVEGATADESGFWGDLHDTLSADSDEAATENAAALAYEDGDEADEARIFRHDPGTGSGFGSLAPEGFNTFVPGRK
ncbi:hypothetical protein EJ08DRAFT_654587 [Tothia fuscella]|uniref:Uncharacterized protein n=1 Tax=Tothia fuscella TaxID=1048955 RepID=A0A9P4NEM2_9PEZI|nr:hypothetical protein EJ08DRAFT_654587 [Tothia fuscella]